VLAAITLPHPPSGNTGTRHARGRHYLTAEVRAYRETVAALVRQERGLAAPLDDRLACVVLWSPPDNRRRDAGNVRKTLDDALTHGGLWQDDSQLFSDATLRGPVTKGGSVLVLVGAWDSDAELLARGVALCRQAWADAAGAPPKAKRGQAKA
jgi:crossover junction endodeoxyribonuclease RusA